MPVSSHNAYNGSFDKKSDKTVFTTTAPIPVIIVRCDFDRWRRFNGFIISNRFKADKSANATDVQNTFITSTNRIVKKIYIFFFTRVIVI